MSSYARKAAFAPREDLDAVLRHALNVGTAATPTKPARAEMRFPSFRLGAVCVCCDVADEIAASGQIGQGTPKLASASAAVTGPTQAGFPRRSLAPSTVQRNAMQAYVSSAFVTPAARGNNHPCASVNREWPRFPVSLATKL